MFFLSSRSFQSDGRLTRQSIQIAVYNWDAIKGIGEEKEGNEMREIKRRYVGLLDVHFYTGAYKGILQFAGNP